MNKRTFYCLSLLFLLAAAGNASGCGRTTPVASLSLPPAAEAGTETAAGVIPPAKVIDQGTVQADAVEVDLRKRFPLERLHQLYEEIDAVDALAQKQAEHVAPMTFKAPASWGKTRTDREIARRADIYNRLIAEREAQYAKKRGLSRGEMLAISKIGYDQGWCKRR